MENAIDLTEGFPLIIGSDGSSIDVVLIPFDLIRHREARAKQIHGKDFQQIVNEDGGLLPSDIIDLMKDRPWSPQPDSESDAALLDEIVTQWRNDHGFKE